MPGLEPAANLAGACSKRSVVPAPTTSKLLSSPIVTWTFRCQSSFASASGGTSASAGSGSGG